MLLCKNLLHEIVHHVASSSYFDHNSYQHVSAPLSQMMHHADNGISSSSNIDSFKQQVVGSIYHRYIYEFMIAT